MQGAQSAAVLLSALSPPAAAAAAPPSATAASTPDGSPPTAGTVPLMSARAARVQLVRVLPAARTVCCTVARRPAEQVDNHTQADSLHVVLALRARSAAVPRNCRT